MPAKNLNRLAISLGICIVIAFLSRLFMIADGPSWGVTIAAILLSFIGSQLISFYLVQGNKKRIVIRRYMLIGLVIVAGIVYFKFWQDIVCSVTIKNKVHDTFVSHKKNIITGTQLIDSSDEIINKLNLTDNRCSICDSLNTHNPEEIWLPASVRQSGHKLFAAFLALVVLVSALVVHIVEEILFANGSTREIQTEKKVFISYSHADMSKGHELYQALIANDIAVIKDDEAMFAGDYITAFVLDSVKKAAITLMIVSEKSLLSGWVATETVNTFFLENFTSNKFFIGCYLDRSFLDPGFVTKALKQIDNTLNATNKEIDERNKLKSDSRDLNAQKTRLITLRANLDNIIYRLQNSFCVDISDGNLDQNLSIITRAIKSKFRQLDE